MLEAPLSTLVLNGARKSGKKQKWKTVLVKWNKGRKKEKEKEKRRELEKSGGKWIL